MTPLAPVIATTPTFPAAPPPMRSRPLLAPTRRPRLPPPLPPPQSLYLSERQHQTVTTGTVAPISISPTPTTSTITTTASSTGTLISEPSRTRTHPERTLSHTVAAHAHAVMNALARLPSHYCNSSQVSFHSQPLLSKLRRIHIANLQPQLTLPLLRTALTSNSTAEQKEILSVLKLLATKRCPSGLHLCLKSPPNYWHYFSYSEPE